MYVSLAHLEPRNVGTENVKVEYSGPAFSINFNSRYVLDVLNIIKEGKVKFFFSKKYCTNNFRELHLLKILCS